MADALPGAVAPTPAAVRAAHPTTTNSPRVAGYLAPIGRPPASKAGAGPLAGAVAQAMQADALTPLQLVRQLDGWLNDTGHGPGHPWRVCIGETLNAYGIDRASPDDRHLADLTEARAGAASDVAHQAALRAVSLVRRAGELACLVAMAAELATGADEAADLGAVWQLRCLLGAMRNQADSLHDLAAGAEGGAA